MFSQRTFQEICKGIHLQKSQEQQTTKPHHKKSGGSKSSLLQTARLFVRVWAHLTRGLPPVESVQKSSAVVRPKDSAAPLSLRDTEVTMEESRSSIQEEMPFIDQTGCSYQQISCLDSVVR